MELIRVENVKVRDSEIVCGVRTEGDRIRHAFRYERFDFTYVSSIPLTGVPESIAVIPVLGTLLPLSWLFNARLEVPSCDADFLRSIPEIRQGYVDMYPGVSFKGELVTKPVENRMDGAEGSLCFFSGGLDSHDTALRHAAERPVLLILRGADISVEVKDDKGWAEILRQVDATASALNSERVSVETNFRHILDYRFLNEWTTGVAGQDASYWYNFHHGLGLLAHAAPIVWQKKIPQVYIASSFTEKDAGKIQCASDPTIDEHVRFCGAGVKHDGYDCSRIQKLRNVSAWCRENGKDVFLRVCHHRGKQDMTGVNCSDCEKCYRTILALYALKEDPNRYGFNCPDMDAFGRKVHKNAHRIVRHFNTRYLPIIRLMRENYAPDEVPEGLRWLYDFSFGEDSEFFAWADRRIAIEYEKRFAAQEKKKRRGGRIGRLEAFVDSHSSLKRLASNVMRTAKKLKR